jgi:hypothetical protein
MNSGFHIINLLSSLVVISKDSSVYYHTAVDMWGGLRRVAHFGPPFNESRSSFVTIEADGRILYQFCLFLYNAYIYLRLTHLRTPSQWVLG